MRRSRPSTSCSAARSACGRSPCWCWPARSCSFTCSRSSPTRGEGKTYRDAFHEPYASWYPELPDALYVGLLWLAAVAAVAMSLGLLTRLATATTFAIVAYNLFLSTTHFHNNRAYLVIVLGLLAVAPCGRELSVDAWLRRRGEPALDPSAPAWPLWLLRFECAAIYGASGLSKLVDPDWFGGTVTWQRVVAAREATSNRGRCRIGRSRPSPTGVSTGRQAHRAHRAVHRARPVVARHPLCGVWIAGRLPRHDRDVGSGAGLLAARHRGARGLGGPLDAGSGASHRSDIRSLSGDWARSSARSTGWRAFASSRRRPPPRSRSLTGTAPARGGPPSPTLSRLPLTAWFALPALLLPAVRRARRAGAGSSPRPPPERRAVDDDRDRSDMSPESDGAGPRPATRVWRAAPHPRAGVALAFVVVAPPERCPTVTAEQLRSSSAAAVDWFVRNQEADGTWLYLYDADEDDPARVQRGSSRRRDDGPLPGRGRGLPGALRSADRGTEWALDALLERDGWAAIEYQGEVSTARAPPRGRADDSPGGDRGHALRRRPAPARALPLTQTEPSGAVLADYDPTSGTPVAGEYSKYYTGEAYWALARLHRLPGRGWGGGGPHRRLPGDLARRGRGLLAADSRPLGRLRAGRDRRVPRARRRAAHRGVRGRLRAPPGGAVRQRDPVGQPAARAVGRGRAGRDTPRGGGYGVIGEALTGWWLVARGARTGRPRGPDRRTRGVHRRGWPSSAQSDGEDAADAARPELVEGAWFADGETRMDDQQHALAALRDDPDRRGAGVDLGRLDPATMRRRLAVGRRPVPGAQPGPRCVRRPAPAGSPADVVGLAAWAARSGALAICVVAAVADPLLDALEISEPSFRTAAGSSP